MVDLLDEQELEELFHDHTRDHLGIVIIDHIVDIGVGIIAHGTDDGGVGIGGGVPITDLGITPLFM